MSQKQIIDISNKVKSGVRLDADDAMQLFASDDIFTIGEMAEIACARHNGNKAYYVRNIHVNPTNICVNRCRFCAFSRSKGEEGAYELSIDDVNRE